MEGKLPNIESFWKNCHEQIKQIAKQYNIEKILYSSGYPVQKPNIVAIRKDALNGSSYGYDVYVFPEGNIPGKPFKYFSITGIILN